MSATVTKNASATEATTTVDPKSHMAPIDTAPKDSKIVAWHPVTHSDVVLEWDATWGSGRGAWFDSNNHVVSPKFWNPLQTGLYNL